MGMPAAKKGDTILAVDMHWILPPLGPNLLIPHPYAGVIDGGLSSDVLMMGQPAATTDSTASNQPPHVPIGDSFVNPPNNRATIRSGSGSVFINGKTAARAGDRAQTCDESKTGPLGKVVAVGTVIVG